jgi:hypothetical protein
MNFRKRPGRVFDEYQYGVLAEVNLTRLCLQSCVRELCVTAISLHLKPAISGTFADAISVPAFLKRRANIEEAG